MSSGVREESFEDSASYFSALKKKSVAGVGERGEGEDRERGGRGCGGGFVYK